MKDILPALWMSWQALPYHADLARQARAVDSPQLERTLSDLINQANDLTPAEIDLLCGKPPRPECLSPSLAKRPAGGPDPTENRQELPVDILAPLSLSRHVG